MGLSTKHLNKEQKELLNIMDKQQKKALSIIKDIDKSKVPVEILEEAETSEKQALNIGNVSISKSLRNQIYISLFGKI